MHNKASMCPNCGAPMTGYAGKCGYCGVAVKPEHSAHADRLNNSALPVAGLMDEEYFESISWLADAIEDDDNNYQFCGIACGDCHFAQVARAFEAYPTLHLYLDKDQYEKFISLGISSYFYCLDPVNYPYVFQSNVYLTPDTMAKILTIFVRNVFEAEEDDLIFDIEEDPVIVDNEGNIIFCNSDRNQTETETAGLGRTLLILLAIFAGMPSVAFLIGTIVEWISGAWW